jgi:prefoldin subunit 5
LLQEQNSELESNIESGKDRLDALNEKISNIENDEERILEIKNQYIQSTSLLYDEYGKDELIVSIGLTMYLNYRGCQYKIQYRLDR